MTADERKQQFALAYRALIESDGFRNLLKLRTSGTLKRFSIGNLIGLMWQAEMSERPLPTLLKTYKGWQKLDRQVQRKDEVGGAWFVIAPNKKKYKAEGEDEERVHIIGWHYIPEFDVSQTLGAPLPEEPGELVSDDHFEQFMLLQDWCIWDLEIPVHWSERTAGAAGFYDRKENAITLREGMASDEALAVLVHEIIHALGCTYQEFSRAEAECITETATAIVLMELGVDHLAQSLDYVSHWAGLEPERALKLLDKAESFARKLESKLGKRAAREEEQAA